MKIFSVSVFAAISANVASDESIGEMITLQNEVLEIFSGEERWQRNMRKNLHSITGAMIRKVNDMFYSEINLCIH